MRLRTTGSENRIKGEKLVVFHPGLTDVVLKKDPSLILKSISFASIYDCDIDSSSSEAIHRNKKLVSFIPIGQVREELCRLLCGSGVLNVLLDYKDIIVEMIPEMGPCVGFDQNSRFHEYTVYGHIAHAVSECLGEDIIVRMSLFLHDIGKPYCYTSDQNGGHFYGHGVISRNIAEKVLIKLQFDKTSIDEITELVLYHDTTIPPTPKSVGRWLRRLGEKQLKRLLKVRMADIKAHAKGTQETGIKDCCEAEYILQSLLSKPFSRGDLAISGNDIMNLLHIEEGPYVGCILEDIFTLVSNNVLENTKPSLTAYIIGTKGVIKDEKDR